MDKSTRGRQSEFEKLLKDLSNGSEEAANRIVELYSANILRAVRKDLPQAIRPKLDSIDIFQSVWLSILTKRTRLAELNTPQRLIAYLAGTARLKVLEKYRHYTKLKGFDVKRENRMSDPIDLEGKSGERAPLAKELITDQKGARPSAAFEAREAWEQLKANCTLREQQILELRLQGKTYEVIADEIGISTRTIKRFMRKILQSVTND